MVAGAGRRGNCCGALGSPCVVPLGTMAELRLSSTPMPMQAVVENACYGPLATPRPRLESVGVRAEVLDPSLAAETPRRQVTQPRRLATAPSLYAEVGCVVYTGDVEVSPSDLLAQARALALCGVSGGLSRPASASEWTSTPRVSPKAQLKGSSSNARRRPLRLPEGQTLGGCLLLAPCRAPV